MPAGKQEHSSSCDVNPVTMMRVRTGEFDREKEGGDDSTIGTTATAHNRKSNGNKEEREDAEGVEILEFFSNSSTAAHGHGHAHGHAHEYALGVLQEEAPPPRPLSPVHTTSQEEEAEEEEAEDDSLIASEASEKSHSLSNEKKDIPDPIPPRPNPRTSSRLPKEDEDVAAAVASAHRSTPGQGRKESQTPPKFQFKDLWQRCVVDCYPCMSTTSTTKGDNSTGPYREDTQKDEDAQEYIMTSGYLQSLLPNLEFDQQQDLNTVVPKLCQQLMQPLDALSIKLRRNALEELAELCDRDHIHNRVPLICSTFEWDNSSNSSDADTTIIINNNNPNPNHNNTRPHKPKVIEALCQIIADPNWLLNDYRQALLILSNLTIPMENKAVLLLGPHRDLLLTTLYQGLTVILDDSRTSSTAVLNHRRTISTMINDMSSDDSLTQSTNFANMQQRKLEVHLVVAILYNLSFLDDGAEILASFAPPMTKNDTSRSSSSLSSPPSSVVSPLDNSSSLLRVLERMVVIFQPLVAPRLVDTDSVMVTASVERQCMRWAFGIARNMCANSNIASVSGSGAPVPTTTLSTTARRTKWIGASKIPLVALQVIRYTPTSQNYQGKWKPQSLEDLAMGLWIELALREEEFSMRNHDKTIRFCPQLYDIVCRDYLQPLIDDSAAGIHSVRARAIVKRFDGIDLMEASLLQSRARPSSSVNEAKREEAKVGTRAGMSHKKQDGYLYCNQELEEDHFPLSSTGVNV